LDAFPQVIPNVLSRAVRLAVLEGLEPRARRAPSIAGKQKSASIRSPTEQLVVGRMRYGRHFVPSINIQNEDVS
jgi:hypothetical protein